MTRSCSVCRVAGFLSPSSLPADLQAPLDILLVRKIGAPGYPEFAIGAVVDGKNPQRVINEDVLAYCGASLEYFEKEAARQLEEIERRRRTYLGNRTPIDLAGRSVILVDDGIATGASVKAGLKALRQVGAGHVTLAVPVAPRSVIDELKNEVDEIFCLSAPDDLRAVSLHYDDFNQTSDDEVTELLARAEHGEALEKLRSFTVSASLRHLRSESLKASWRETGRVVRFRLSGEGAYTGRDRQGLL